MRYLLLIYTDQNVYAGMNEDEMQADMAKWWDYDGAIKGAGRELARRGPAADHDRDDACVDDGGKPLVTDGPFAETREQLGGFYLLDVENLDQAIEWAHKCPAATYGKVELRPIQEFEQG